MIELHYTGTPNGYKIGIMLEETGLEFTTRYYDLFEGEQLTADYGLINPNHKIPAIVDRDPADGGAPFAVFESGAILQYLADKTGRFLPTVARDRSTAIQWLTWQMAGFGPMIGQAGHFVRYAPVGQDYAIARYMKETTRLHHVLNRRLQEAPYLAGDEYSIADIAVWPWHQAAVSMGFIDYDILNLEATRDWMERVASRPAVQRSLARDDMKAPAKYVGRKQVLTSEEWSNVFGDKQHDAVKTT